MGRTLFSLVSATAFILLSSPASIACTCALPPSDKSVSQQVIEARNDSDAVFLGKVVKIFENPKNDLGVVVRMSVTKAWKNVYAEEVLIVTGRGGGDCGYHFEMGESYLVYAYWSNGGRLGTNICKRTRKYSEAGEDLKVLGKGRVPRNAKHSR